MALFSDLFKQILGPTEQVQFTVSKNADGTLTALITPLLKQAPNSLSDELAQIRASLARPARMMADAATLDRDFPVLLRKFTETRSILVESLTDLESLEEAARQAQAKVHKARAKSSAKPALPEPTTEPDTTTNPATTTNVETGTAIPPTAPAEGNPDSLF
ncbi:MAG: PRTRC system protein E [Candidatus Competibacteraceae bacterium]|jgi:PRTRC genetic system protein E|nr:PRTRC system protein E [Candidatus Competibacteraceae bacterium]